MLAARVAAGLGELKRCAELLERVPTQSQLKLEALFRQGQSYRELYFARQAEETWREVISLCEERGLDSSHYLFSAKVELISLMSLERRVRETRELLWQLYPRHPEKWRLLVTMARLEAKPAYPQLAMPMLEKCLEQDSGDLDACRGLALYSLDVSQWKEAADLASYCLEHDPLDKLSLEILLECKFRLQEWDAMDEILARPDLDDSSARVWRLRGQRLETLSKAEEAEQCFREALRLNPNDPTTHFQLAQLLRRSRALGADEHQAEFRRLQGDTEAIARVISSFSAQNPENWAAPEPATCIELATHCNGLGRIEEARGWVDQALRQVPDFPAALELQRQFSELSAPSE